MTADFFVSQLRRAGEDFRRLDTEQMAELSLTFAVTGHEWSGTVATTDRGASSRLNVRDIRAVYCRRPRAPVLPPDVPAHARVWMETEIRRAWGGVLHALPDVRWINAPLAVSGASYKPEQLVRATRFGLAVPDTLLTSDPAAALRFCEDLAWDVVAKPVGHGEIIGETPDEDRVVYTNLVRRNALEQFARIAHCPTLLQRRVAKAVDLRVTIVGRECLTVALHSQEQDVSALDCRRDNMTGMRYSRVTLPHALAAALVELTHSYGLYYAAIDLVHAPDGRYWFLELNPAGQWAWLEQETSVPISDALIRCLSAGP